MRMGLPAHIDPRPWGLHWRGRKEAAKKETVKKRLHRYCEALKAARISDPVAHQTSLWPMMYERASSSGLIR